MATFEIVKVRTVKPQGAAHEHITAVQVAGGYEWSKHTVIRDLRDPHGDRYYTWGGGVRANVIVRSCPHCTAHDYITTEPDYTTANNLLHLPRF
jgi:Protein of unknown function (DUF3892)